MYVRSDHRDFLSKIAALKKFVSRVTSKCLPFFRTLKRAFEWTTECQLAFGDLKAYLSSPPLLSLPRPKEELFLYLAVSSTVVSATLARKRTKPKDPYTSLAKLFEGQKEGTPYGETRLCVGNRSTQAQAILSSLRYSCLDRKTLEESDELSRVGRTNGATGDQDEGEWIKEYLEQVKYQMQYFNAKFIQIPREENERANRLAKIASADDMSLPSQKDAQAYVRKCVKCQRFGNLIRQPTEDLAPMMALWPFAQWGLDIMGSFPIAVRYGIPRILVSDNGKQFNNNAFRDFCSQLGIKNHYSSPTHPQANGQVEVTNQSLLKIIKTRLVGTKGIRPEELASVL
ncbi:uncharacterized protein LOC142616176 [Castanea sativa]|uniref:uncharacterized protein LOC142616176 n=1 Tax=Castanea sativa TaxID=21020 RepID=UPI003F64EE64